MKRSTITCAVIGVMTLGLPLLTIYSGQPSEQKTPTSKVRVGTFDSRCLAVAYYRSEMFKSQSRRLQTEYEKAKAAGDRKRIEELEAQGKMIHKQSFSTWPVDNILERIKGKIPETAKQAGVDVIISKWDLAYKRSGVELVDVTPLLVKLIVDDEKSVEDALKIRKMRPIPREKTVD